MKNILVPISILLQKRFVKFSIVGTSGVVVNMGCLYILKEALKLELMLSSAIAIELSIIFNFFLNDIWIWSDREKSTFPLTI